MSARKSASRQIGRSPILPARSPAAASAPSAAAVPARRRSRHDASLQGLLVEASRQATANLERVLAPQGLPLEFWRVLEVLGDEQGRTMTALADGVAMKLPSLSKTIDRMVAAALVQRAPDQADQRRVLVYVSDIGLAKLDSLRGSVRRQQASLETSLGSGQGRELKRLLRAFIRGQQP